MAGRKTDIRRVRAVATGRVQGVGFRYFVQREAARLALDGWVRNLANGNVETVVQGPQDKLELMLARLREGPALSWVEHLAVDRLEPDDSLTSFEIRSTGW